MSVQYSLEISETLDRHFKRNVSSSTLWAADLVVSRSVLRLNLWSQGCCAKWSMDCWVEGLFGESQEAPGPEHASEGLHMIHQGVPLRSQKWLSLEPWGVLGAFGGPWVSLWPTRGGILRCRGEGEGGAGKYPT